MTRAVRNGLYTALSTLDLLAVGSGHFVTHQQGTESRILNNLQFGRHFANVWIDMGVLHVGKIKIKDSKNSGECLVCRSDVGLLRRLIQHRFCCREHEQMYLAELEEVAVTRLRALDATGRARCSSRP